MSDPELHGFSAPGSPNEFSHPPLPNSAPCESRSPSSSGCRPSKRSKTKGKAGAPCTFDVPTSRSVGGATPAHASSAFGVFSQRFAEDVAPPTGLDEQASSVDKSFNLAPSGTQVGFAANTSNAFPSGFRPPVSFYQNQGW